MQEVFLSSDDLKPDFSAARSVEFAEEDTLPGALADFPVGDRYHQAWPEQARFNVGVGIAFGMGVSSTGWNQFFGTFQDVMNDGRICVFVDGQSGSGVGAVQ